MRQDGWQVYLDKRGDLVSIDAMAIHDSHHPQVVDPIEVLLDNIAVLVHLPHLWDKASPRLVRDGLNDLTLAGY